MYRILDKRVLNQTQTVFAFDVEAPLAARKALPGQFIVFQIDEYGERIPVTIAAADRDRGVVTIIVQAVGKSTRQLSRMQAGESWPASPVRWAGPPAWRGCRASASWAAGSAPPSPTRWPGRCTTGASGWT